MSARRELKLLSGTQPTEEQSYTPRKASKASTCTKLDTSNKKQIVGNYDRTDGWLRCGQLLAVRVTFTVMLQNG